MAHNAPAPYDVYREQLASLHYGHALWQPDPAGLYDHVAVGDVGYIRQGHFHRLFNILLPEDDPSHDVLGVPEDFEPLNFTDRPHLIRKLPLRQGDYCSNSVRSSDLSMGAQVAAGAIPVTGNFRVSYGCTRKHGAILSLPTDATQEDTTRPLDFKTYIRKNAESWHVFARYQGIDIKLEDLVLVSGCDRTQSWALAAFINSSSRTEISFDASVLNGSLSAPIIRWQAVQFDGMSVPYNYGPQPEQMSGQNQCVFIRGYRIKKRALQILPSKLLAAAGPSSYDPDPENENEDQYSSALEVEDEYESQYHDPLHAILDFVLDECPHADIALVHDDDLQHIQGVDILSAEAVSSYLKTATWRMSYSSMLEESVAQLSDILGDIIEVPASRTHTAPDLDQPSRDFKRSALDYIDPEISSPVVQDIPSTSDSRLDSAYLSDAGGEIHDPPWGSQSSPPKLSLEAFPAAVGPMYNHHKPVFSSGSSHPSKDLLTDGYIFHTFGTETAEYFFTEALLKCDHRSIMYHEEVPNWNGAFFVNDDANLNTRPNPVRTPHGSRLALVDYSIPSGSDGLVLPQRLWSPSTETDRRHVIDTRIELPIFFVHKDGALGISVNDAVQGRCRLRGINEPAPLGGKAFTHIRICVQGMRDWKRIIIETLLRKPITLERLIKHVGRAVQAFLEQAERDPMPASSNQRFVDTRRIRKEHIVIIGVVNVSRGSWQPILQTNAPLV